MTNKQFCRIYNDFFGKKENFISVEGINKLTITPSQLRDFLKHAIKQFAVIQNEDFENCKRLLNDLTDFQNGSPLEQHRIEYEKTMDEVYTFLNEHD